MKKCVKILSLAFAIVLISGCGSKKEFVKTCTLTSNDPTTGYKLESEYKIYGEGDVANKVVTVETVSTDDQDSLDYFEEYFKSTYASINEVYGGYDNKVTNKDGKVTSETTVDYNKMDLEQYVKDNSAMKNYVNKDNKMLVDGLVKTYEALGATCK